MSNKFWSGLSGAAMALLLSGAAFAADVTTFESCVDSNGKTLPAVVDDAQTVLVRTVTEQGKSTIHYNPAVLPRLTLAAHLFLYTHECARHGLGNTSKAASAAVARKADCMAVNTMMEGALVLREDLPSLQAELSFSSDEWQLIPGPVRAFELTTCGESRGNALRIPANTVPTDKQVNWNNCTRACADRLWSCQNRSAGNESEGCMATYRQCKSNCGEVAKPAKQTD